MTTLYRATTTFTGLQGLPGYSTMYADSGNIDPGDFVDAIHDFWEAVNQAWTDDLTATVSGQLDNVDSTTGLTTGTTDGGADQVTVGTSGGEVLPFTTQLLVRWRTGVYFGGRELRGRTFIPGYTEADSDAGVVNSTVRSEALAAGAILGPNALAVYSPTKHEWASVSRCEVWDQWASLRSRRD